MIKTVSLETAKLLKEAGFRQDKIEFYWLTSHQLKYILNQPIPNSLHETSFLASHEDHRRWTMKEEFSNYSAPTTDELLEELPYSLRYLESDYWLWITKMKHDGYEVRYTDAFHQIPKKVIQNDILPEALAQIWLWLKKEKLI